MAEKYRIFKEGNMWSVQYPGGATLSLPKWEQVMEDVARTERRKRIREWKKRLRLADGTDQPRRMSSKERIIDARHTERVALLMSDPDEYFRRYPAPRFGFDRRNRG